MTQRRWQSADVEKAIEMHDGGLSWPEVARAIGETLRSLDMAVIRYRNSAEPPHFYLGHLNGPAIGTCDEAINLRRNAILGSANLRAQIELVFGVAA